MLQAGDLNCQAQPDLRAEPGRAKLLLSRKKQAEERLGGPYGLAFGLALPWRPPMG